jgi:hypothetical protein
MQFIASSSDHFWGTVLILLVTLQGIAQIVAAARRQPE